MSRAVFKSGSGERAIGLDIGSTAIKVVEVNPRGGGFQITRFAHRVVPPEAHEQDDRIAQIIRDLFHDQGIKNRNVYLAVSGSSVTIRRATLPKMPAGELIEAIKWDAREEVLFPLEDASVDYYVTAETMQEGTPFLEMLTVIAEGSFINRQVALVKSAGLNLLGINAFPVALIDYDQILTKGAGEGVTGFIDMGAERTRVYFASGNDLLFFREIPTGGQNLTEALLEPFETEDGTRLVLEESRAEEIKMEHGLPEEHTPGTTSEGIPLAELHERLLPVLNKQAEELYRSVDYFKNLFKRDDITRLTVSGGAGGLKGFYRFLSEMLELRIEQFNPLAQSSPPVSGLSEGDAFILGPSLTAATGLGLGHCDKINLLPQALRPSLKKELFKLVRVSVLPLLLIALVLFSTHTRNKVRDKERALQIAQQELAQSQQTLQQLDRPKQELKQLETSKTRLNERRSEMPIREDAPVNFPKMFKALAQLIPRNASIERVTYAPLPPQENDDPGKILGISIEGQVFGNEVQTLASLDQLIVRLERSLLFSRIRLEETRDLGTETYSAPGLSFRMTGFPAESEVKVPS